MTAIEAITNNLLVNYPRLVEGDTIVEGYYFIDCAKNTVLPVTELEDVKKYLIAYKITDFAMVILFNNNIIGYRLSV